MAKESAEVTRLRAEIEAAKAHLERTCVAYESNASSASASAILRDAIAGGYLRVRELEVEFAKAGAA